MKTRKYKEFLERSESLIRGQIREHGVRLSRDRPFLISPRPEDWVTVLAIYCGMTRRRDPDNGLKAICDALERGRVVKNDNQFDAVTGIRSRAWKEEKQCLVTVSLISCPSNFSRS